MLWFVRKYFYKIILRKITFIRDNILELLEIFWRKFYFGWRKEQQFGKITIYFVSSCTRLSQNNSFYRVKIHCVVKVILSCFWYDLCCLLIRNITTEDPGPTRQEWRRAWVPHRVQCLLLQITILLSWRILTSGGLHKSSNIHCTTSLTRQ